VEREEVARAPSRPRPAELRPARPNSASNHSGPATDALVEPPRGRRPPRCSETRELADRPCRASRSPPCPRGTPADPRWREFLGCALGSPAPAPPAPRLARVALRGVPADTERPRARRASSRAPPDLSTGAMAPARQSPAASGHLGGQVLSRACGDLLEPGIRAAACLERGALLRRRHLQSALQVSPATATRHGGAFWIGLLGEQEVHRLNPRRPARDALPQQTALLAAAPARWPRGQKHGGAARIRMVERLDQRGDAPGRSTSGTLDAIRSW